MTLLPWQYIDIPLSPTSMHIITEGNIIGNDENDHHQPHHLRISLTVLVYSPTLPHPPTFLHFALISTFHRI